MAVDQSRLVCLEVFRLLRQERERRGLSKYALANASGVSQQMIAYIESEERNPTLEILLRLARALEVDLGILIQKAERSVARSKK